MTTPEHALFTVVKPLIPGIAGVVISLKFLPKETTYFNRLTSLLAGLIIYYYLGGVLVEHYQLAGVYRAATEFLTGVFGLGICSHLYNAIPQVITGIITKYTGNSGEQ